MRSSWASRLISSAALALAAGCAAAPAGERRFDAPYGPTFRAAARALAAGGAVEADEGAGRLATGWREAIEPRTQGYVLDGHFVERRLWRLEVRPAAGGAPRTEVAVYLRVEERAPGGVASIAWRRAEARPELADALLDRISQEIAR
jgi:hypothetical protein